MKNRAMGSRLLRMHERLYAHFGPRRWWPGETPFEVIVGAVLTQNTAWKNVEKAIAALKAAGALSLEGLRAAPQNGLARWIVPAGYYNQKAQALKAVVAFIDREYGGDLDTMFAAPTDRLRRGLLGVPRVGPETADSILLYAAGKPVFVVDAYTKRILARHGILDEKAGYEEVRRLFEENLPRRVRLYNELHAQLVAAGNAYCRKTRPLCEACPLGPMLPRGVGGRRVPAAGRVSGAPR